MFRHQIHNTERERKEVMKEEDILRKKYGTEPPYRVPDSYFEQLTSDVMSALPERQIPPPSVRPTTTHRLRILWYAAAIVAGLVFYIGLHPFGQTDNVSPSSEQNFFTEAPSGFATSNDNSDDIDEWLDYTMMNNSEIEYYLTKAN